MSDHSLFATVACSIDRSIDRSIDWLIDWSIERETERARERERKKKWALSHFCCLVCDLCDWCHWHDTSDWLSVSLFLFVNLTSIWIFAHDCFLACANCFFTHVFVQILKNLDCICMHVPTSMFCSASLAYGLSPILISVSQVVMTFWQLFWTRRPFWHFLRIKLARLKILKK